MLAALQPKRSMQVESGRMSPESTMPPNAMATVDERVTASTSDLASAQESCDKASGHKEALRAALNALLRLFRSSRAHSPFPVGHV